MFSKVEFSIPQVLVHSRNAFSSDDLVEGEGMSTRLPRKELVYFGLILIIAAVGLRAAEFLLVTTFRPDISQIELYNRIKNLENSDSKLTGQIQSFQNQLEKLEGELQNATYSVDLTKLYSRTAKSVVLIENRVMIRGTLFAQSLGSGFVYSADGYVVTNNHVVQGASELVVTFLDGNASKATVVGTDHYSDLAVVKLERDQPG